MSSIGVDNKNIKNSRFHSDTKGILNVVVTGVLGIACAYAKDVFIAWVVILIAIIMQVVLIFIPTMEEQYYLKRYNHKENIDGSDMDTEEQLHKLENEKKVKKMQDEAKKVSEEKPKEHSISESDRIRRIYTMPQSIIVRPRVFRRKK